MRLKKGYLVLLLLLVFLLVVSCVPQQISDEELATELAKLTPEEREALMTDLENEKGALAGQVITNKFSSVSPEVAKALARASATQIKDAITRAADTILKQCNDKKDNDNDGLIDFPVDPGCVSLSDGSESDNLERDKAYAYAWGDATINSSLLNIITMAVFYPHNPPQNYTADFSNEKQIKLYLDNLKKITDAQPEGHRVIQIHGLDTWRIPGSNDVVLYPNESVNGFVDKNGIFKPYLGIFWESSTKEVSDDMTYFFTKYKEIGGKVDWVVQDYENNYQDVGKLMAIADGYYDSAHPSMGWKNKQDAEYAYFKALEEDPRFQLEHKPFFDKYNYSWIKDCLLTTVECDKRWSVYIRSKVDYYLTKSFYEPISKIFPNVKNSNFNTGYFNPSYCFPDMAGNTKGFYFCFEGQNGSHVGTHQSPYTYGRLGCAIATKKLDGKNNYSLTPFNAFKYDVNKLRLSVLSSDVPITPWVMLKSSSMLYDQHTYIPLYGTPYWEELVLHDLLTGADDLLYMKPGKAEYPNLVKEFNLAEKEYSLLDKDDLALNNVLEEFNKIAGFANRKSLVKDLAGWGDNYVLTGMQSGGRNVYRFTPNNVTIFAVVENASGVSFVSKDDTVFIKNGVIYEPEKKVSPIGYWVVQLMN